jgi:hypothetical protein
MIELLLPYGFDTLEYTWVKATIGIYMLADYSVAKKCQQRARHVGLAEQQDLGGEAMSMFFAPARYRVIKIMCSCSVVVM